MKLGYIIVLAIGLTATFLKNFQEEKETAESSSFELKTQVNELENATKDLSDKVEYFDQRVKDQAAEIERLGATSQRILNNVNHELRLPVGNVMNFTEMLNESLDTYEEKHIKMLTEEVYKNSTRLSTMILNMLDLATLEVNDIKLELQDLNLVSLIKERVETCKKIYLDGKNINFAFDMPTSLNYKCDANYFRQIVDNLVINSIKHSKEGLVKIRLLQDQKWIKIIIEDQGDGIPKEDLFDIFTPFRIGVKHQTPAEGRGVGLALCKSALEAHGGTITANSEGGKGAKFTIILPVQ